MREIKFRAWDLNKKEMVLFPHKTKDLVFTDFGPSIMYFHKGMQLPLIDNKLYLMQYTGLKDTNGKEIYEGDILQDEDNFYNAIIFYNGSFRSKQSLEFLEDICDFTKIIGNIYENPELLKEKSK